MDALPAASTFACAQCGGALDPAVGQRFGECPYCGSSIFFDRSRSVLHFLAERTLDETTARARLQAWMAGNRTVKGLERQAAVGAAAFTYFPLWRFVAGEGQKEKQWCEPARAFTVAGLGDLPLSGGALRYVTRNDAQLPLAEPEVQLESAFDWLSGRGVPRSEVREASMVHLPLYEFPYTWRDRSWKAWVDGVSGRILAGVYPAKSETPYVALFVIALVVFLGLGLSTGSFFVRLLLFLGASVPLGLVALGVVRKV
jgi:DNA-directed RNA polymerase subunit RPC12/RpoP